MAKEDKEKKGLFFKKKEDKTSTKEQRILFFCFYLVFFLIIFLLIFSNKSSKPNDAIDDNGNNEEESSVVVPNYNFQYSLEIDDNTYIYSGKKLYKKELFTYIENDVKSSYYKDNDKYYKKMEDGFKEDVNPYKYEMFLDIDKVDYLFYNAEEVNTKEEKNRKIFYYEILSSTLSENIDGTFVEDGEEKNTFNVFVNLKTSKIEKIEINLDDYAKKKGLAEEKFRVVLEYSNFGNIKEIKNPVD